MGLSPMMQQYLAIKEQHPESILFFRLGDFYEMFFEDAKLASQELELVLTGRDCGLEERAPMCGVPFHSCETYIARLINKGYKVAICEQTEDPALTKGLVKREVVRVITPGTVIEGSMLDEGRNNYFAVVYATDRLKEVGLCFVDSSTGELHVTQLQGSDVRLRIYNELGRFSPREVLMNDIAFADDELTAFVTDRLTVAPEQLPSTVFDCTQTEQSVLLHFDRFSLDELDLQDRSFAVRALGGALYYLYATQMTGLERVNQLRVYSDAQYMKLDITARRNLELIETMRNKEKRGSLLGVLDKTRTAMGKRLIRSWIEQPLLHPAHIIRRQNAVACLLHDSLLREDLLELLSDVYDLERIMTRMVYGSANAKELRSLHHTIARLAPIRERLSGVDCALLQEIYRNIDPLDDLYALIDSAIVEDPPFSVREGGMIKDGYDLELDEMRTDMTDGKGIIARIEAQEKEKTGIKGLRVGYNRVFGYYIEILRSYEGEVPEHYIRKQTLANAERYITQELKELETRVLSAKERSVALEYQLFTAVRDTVAAQLTRIQSTAEAVASLDVLCSFATVALKHKYVCPVIDMNGVIDIKNGRHPVVESLQTMPFVPNDVYLDNHRNRVAVITGPNMAGKSTYMRQTALIVLLAQIGSFVSADSATVGIVDSIFTRVGASDDLASGQSTFMVEMSEVASILKNATKDSLIVFDEIGRGTSTFDGMSIARAVLEFVTDPHHIGAKTLFATHYHELTAMESEIDGIHNYNVAVKKHGDDITFLRRIVKGPADDSYGIEVAKLAGVPDGVVARAKEILKEILNGEGMVLHSSRVCTEEEDGQLSLLPAENNAVLRRLKELDVNVLTPIEALQILYDLNREAQQY